METISNFTKQLDQPKNPFFKALEKMKSLKLNSIQNKELFDNWDPWGN